MEKTLQNQKTKLWKRILSIVLAVIIGFGTFVVFTFGNSRFQKWLGINSVLSAYAAEMVDTKGAVAVDEEAMLADDHTINLENKDGSNTVYLFSEPISYTDENGNLKTKDISVEKADKKLKSRGYEYTNGQNDYRINFSKDYNTGVQAEFDNCSYSIIPISDYDTVGKETVAEYLNEKFEVFQYKNIYGDGTNLRFYPQLNGIKDEIVLDSNIGKNTFSFKIETNNCIASLDDNGAVVLKNTDDEVVQTFSKPFAYDSDFVDGIYDEHYVDCEYTLDEISNGSYMLSVSVDKNWLESESTVYPVTIDPTTVNVDTYRDAGVYSKVPNNCYGAEETACIGRSSEYGNGRIYLQFFMPTEIKKGAKINSAFIWMRETTGRTSNMYVQPYLVKSSWNEGITWNTRSYMDNTSDMPTKNINSQSTDWASSPYWYKMYITSAVQKWTDGERTNYGIGLYSDEEEKSTYNWRAFATIQNSTSSYRPYTVINYTNDTTAPTVTSVTGNASDWTNGNVTLKVNGAKDNDGGIGLHTTTYSFSTSKDTYNWQKENYKTFSSNCTVYIYVRDAWDNRRLVSTQTINKIDKDAPSTPTVTGNPEDWTTDKVTLTASSSDSASGIKDYSFSTTQGVYSWQTENTKQFDENATVYVYARDNAGNISAASEAVVIDKIDNKLPIGKINYDYKTDWVSSICIRADASDELSGLPKECYSFSSKENEYIWQSYDWKNIYENGTYYIYVRDNASNISLIDTVTINNIDHTAPEIKDIKITNGEKIVITINAQDEQSGIQAYSIDNGTTWQSSNVFEIAKDSVNFIAVTVKDKVNNCSSIEHRDFITPKVYNDGDKVGIYNPNLNIEFEDYRIYYSINKPTSYKDWTLYKAPIILPDDCNEIYVSFYKTSNTSDIKPIPIDKLESVNYFKYTETNTDLSLSYKGSNFNINRQYKDDKWNYSIDTNMSVMGYDFAEVNLPDFTKLTYVRRSKYLYTCESKYSSITVIYDITDINIQEYVCKYQGLNYHYDLEGKLVKISNSNSDLFNVTYEQNKIIITDIADRKTVMNYEDGKLLSITDADNGTVNYVYNGNDLVKVIDQAGVVINEYVYKNAVLVKSGYNNIYTDDEERITKIEADNGSYSEYEYTDSEVIVSNSDYSVKPVKYNYYGNIIESVDGDDNVITYTYDSSNRLEYIYKNGELFERYIYDRNGRLARKNNSTGYTFTRYDDNGYPYLEVDNQFSEKDKAYITHYVTDDKGNTIVKAKAKVHPTDCKYNDFPETYEPGYRYQSVTKYEYSDGLLIKTTEKDNEVVNSYDEYSNLIKSVTTVTEDDVTTVSISESKYDNLGRLILSISSNSNISYVYDSAGRTLLTNADGNFTRTVYDERGRTIQEISTDDYDPEKDDLPNDYIDKDIGVRYIYDNVGNLIKVINESNVEIDYEYSDTGSLQKKSFDIYDYYYQEDGQCYRMDIGGNKYAEFGHKVETSDDNEFYYDSVSYADGYVEKYKYDINDNLRTKYANDSYFYNLNSANEEEITYSENENRTSCLITSTTNHYKFLKKDYSGKYYEYKYEVSLNNVTNAKTIIQVNESGYYETVVNNGVTNFTSNHSNFDYYVMGDENSSTQLIKNDSQDILESSVKFDENTNSFTKVYDSLELEYQISYDDFGNIITDGINNYTYNDSGELVKSTGKANASYAYDTRGNLLSITNNDKITVFSYDSNHNLLTAINDENITYNENGNIVSKGNTEYEWTHGNLLKKVTGQDFSASYTYDSNGDRVSKYTNGVTTKFDIFNGKILEQHDKNNILHFQYSDETLVGFILNHVQYYYVTNLNGDIVAITDANGNLVAKYTYDVWGNVLDIEPFEKDNEEQLNVARLNPFRYRGYYYDNESGLYYCNSRYYSPELCRFITPLDYSSIDSSNKYTLNRYAYCYNSPIVHKSYENSFKATVSNETNHILKNCLDEIKSVNDVLKDVAQDEKEKLKEKANTLVKRTHKLYASLKSKYDKSIDKLEQFINYPDVALSTLLSKMFNKDINIRFKLINLLREKANLKIDLSALKNILSLDSSKPRLQKAKSIVSEVGKVIGAVITEIFVCLDLQEIAKKIKTTFSFNNLEEYKLAKTKLYTKWFNDFNKFTKITDRINAATGFISSFSSFVPWDIGKAILTALPFVTSAVNDFSGRYFSAKGAFIMLGYDWLISISSSLGAVGISSENKIAEALIGLFFGEFFDLFGKENAQNDAYNWYL